jgi:hypothetical protein
MKITLTLINFKESSYSDRIFGNHDKKNVLFIHSALMSGILLIFSPLLSLDQWQLQQLQLEEAMAQEWYSGMNLCATGGPEDLLRYTGPGITIEYHCSWQELTSNEVPVTRGNSSFVTGFVAPLESESDPVQESVIITSTKIEPGTPLELLVNNEIDNHLAPLPDFQKLESVPMNVSEGLAPAHVIIYNATNPAVGEMLSLEVFTTDGDELFVLGFASQPDKFESYLPTVLSMIGSLQFFDLSTYLTPEPPGPNGDSPPDRIITPDCGIVTDGTPCYE